MKVRPRFPKTNRSLVLSSSTSTTILSLSRHRSHILVALLCSMHVATSLATNYGSLSRITMRISPKREHEKTCRANDDVVTTFSVMALSPICKAVDVARQTYHLHVGLSFITSITEQAKVQSYKALSSKKKATITYRYRGLFFKNQTRLKQSKVPILKRPTHKSTL